MADNSSSDVKVKESKSAKAGLSFPVARFQRHLRNGNYANHIGTAASVYLTSVVEYLVAEIIELAGAAALDHNRVRIVPRHIMMAIKNDQELNELLKDACFANSGVMPSINPVLNNKNKPKTVARNPTKSGNMEMADGNSADDGESSDDGDSDDEGGSADERDSADEGDSTDEDVVAGSQNF